MTVLRKSEQSRRAFTLVESLISTALVSIFFVSLYAGISQGFGILANARENLRANQILVDKMEEFRLYSWDQVNSFGSSTSFIPTNFVESAHPPTTADNSSSGSVTTTNAAGLLYHGEIIVTNVAWGTSYDTNMRQVTIMLNWTNGSIPHHHSMSSIISQYGLQKYIY
jgi:prepilin-type N-terminal cleavage/methylation domain-containing protein